VDNVALDGGWQMRVIGLRDVMVGQVRPALTMLAASVGLLLLIACANASAGALARITTKRQALGVRIALGATRENIIALLASESVLLALVAAMVALPSSVVIRRVLVQFAPVTIPRQAGIAVDGWTILFALGVGAITGLVTVLGPALWLRHLDVSTFLSDAGRSSTHSRARRRTSSMFVVVQLALATVLVSATARVYSTFSRLDRVDPGFARDHITTATLALGGMRYQSAAARLALTSQLLEKVRALPGVEHAAVTSLLPLSGGLMSSAYSVRGMATDSSRSAALRAVSADFFTALGIPIRRGRAIDAGDNARAVRVAVVNEAFERESFAGRSAIGQSLVLTPPGSDTAQEFEIVGIAGDAKEKDLLGPATPIIYFSDAQASFPHTVLAVRARGDFPAAGVRAALRDLDPPLALDDVGPLGERVRASYALQLFLLWILGAFAVSGALLIAVGIYGSVSFSVAAELRSIGVRMAVGATPQGILGAVLGRGAVLASLGCTLGVGVAVLLPRVGGLERLLGTSVGLAAAVVGACAVLFVALIATAIPARRASTLDPVIVLRSS
jgi:predicted permease